MPFPIFFFAKNNLKFKCYHSGLDVIKHISSSAKLSMKFQLLINVETVKNCGKFRFKTKKLVIYPAHKC